MLQLKLRPLEYEQFNRLIRPELSYPLLQVRLLVPQVSPTLIPLRVALHVSEHATPHSPLRQFSPEPQVSLRVPTSPHASK